MFTPLMVVLTSAQDAELAVLRKLMEVVRSLLAEDPAAMLLRESARSIVVP